MIFQFNIRYSIYYEITNNERFRSINFILQYFARGTPLYSSNIIITLGMHIAQLCSLNLVHV